MNLIDDSKLDTLVKHAAAHSISVWMPAHRAGADIRQDPIRMKNLLTRAREQLIALGVRGPEADDRLSPARALAEDEDFWRHQSAGLGVFLNGGARRAPEIIRLPLPAPERVTVCEHFYLLPLLAAVRRNGRFHLLQLSKKQVRLFRGDRTAFEEVELPNAPGSFDEFMRFDDPERHVEYHTGTARHHPGVNRSAVFHGQGAAADETWEKRRLIDYCRQIDDDVAKRLYEDKAPLLLAAAEPIQSMFRQVSECPRLDERAVEGNPDETPKQELHRRAVALLEGDFARPVERAASRFHRARRAGLAAETLETVLQAASARAVETLMVVLGEQRWGRFDAGRGTLERHDTQHPGDEELLNLAAVLAAASGADVLPVEGDNLPEDSPLKSSPAAAVLRFRPGR